jgi:hypothetical protein
MALCTSFRSQQYYSVCNCNCIGGFARDDSLPQHLAAASFLPLGSMSLERPWMAIQSREPIEAWEVQVNDAFVPVPSTQSKETLARCFDICLIIHPATKGACLVVGNIIH